MKRQAHLAPGRALERSSWRPDQEAVAGGHQAVAEGRASRDAGRHRRLVAGKRWSIDVLDEPAAYFYREPGSHGHHGSRRRESRNRVASSEVTACREPETIAPKLRPGTIKTRTMLWVPSGSAP